MATDYVRVFDTTLRDGEQSPGASLTSAEKLEIARQLARLGVDIIEAGFPAASPDDLEAVKTIAREVGHSSEPDAAVPIIAGLARANATDIDTCWEAVRHARSPRIHTFLATSDIHLQHKLKMTRDEVVAKVREMVTRARALCADVEFSPEDAGRSDRDFLRTGAHGGDRGGRDDAEHPRHGRLHHAGGVRRPHRRADRDHARGRPRDVVGALPRRPRDGHGQRAGGHAGGRQAGGSRRQRHRRARRQHVARRGRDGAAHAACRVRAAHRHRHHADRAHVADGVELHRHPGAAEQGHRRRQRVRARSGHPPGRHAQEPAHVRDHAARNGRRRRIAAGPGQALGPARAQVAPRRARLHAGRRRPGSRLRRVQEARRQEEGDRQRGSRGTGRRGALAGERPLRARRHAGGLRHDGHANRHGPPAQPRLRGAGRRRDRHGPCRCHVQGHRRDRARAEHAARVQRARGHRGYRRPRPGHGAYRGRRTAPDDRCAAGAIAAADVRRIRRRHRHHRGSGKGLPVGVEQAPARTAGRPASRGDREGSAVL